MDFWFPSASTVAGYALSSTAAAETNSIPLKNFVAIFVSEKWPVAIYIWPIRRISENLGEKWPEKVANWPDLKTKVASKNYRFLYKYAIILI